MRLGESALGPRTYGTMDLRPILPAVPGADTLGMDDLGGGHVENTETLVVGIGRNSYTDRDAGTVLPLGDTEWRTFQARVVELLTSAGGTVYFAGEGSGWSEQWGEEDAYTVVAGVRVTDYLRRAFATLAVAFGQDAIALTVGSTSFVGRGGWTQ